VRVRLYVCQRVCPRFRECMHVFSRLHLEDPPLRLPLCKERRRLPPAVLAPWRLSAGFALRLPPPPAPPGRPLSPTQTDTHTHIRTHCCACLKRHASVTGCTNRVRSHTRARILQGYFCRHGVRVPPVQSLALGLVHRGPQLWQLSRQQQQPDWCARSRRSSGGAGCRGGRLGAQGWRAAQDRVQHGAPLRGVRRLVVWWCEAVCFCRFATWRAF
jgi:hypothetical protein